ncbi:O-antigen translocase [Halomonas sp. YLGW01]|uniref:O-antigen translocase n=1 Tax=Halomonas sp. YLGW01 TaxID=2773308 RepID=UPI00177ED4B5|nr:O-antigen translocase [Halomonas sp. YLGW01]
MTLIKTSFLSLIATTVKILAGLSINKAVSVFVGPSGLAVIGQFQNIMQLSMTMAQGGINTGVTKYTAQYGVDGEQLIPLLATAARISLVCSLIVGLGLIIFSHFAAQQFLESAEFSYIFVLFGCTIVLFVINQLLLSIVNGLKEVKNFVLINVAQNTFSLFYTTLLVVYFGLDGALVALVTNQSIVLALVIWHLRNHAIVKLQTFKRKFDLAQAKKLFRYSAMAITTATAVPISHLVIRNYLGETLGWEKAGYWQAIWYISSMYLMVVTTTLGIYYLPRLSEINDKKKIVQELLAGYKLIMPVVMVMAVTIYLLKDFIIWLLFSPSFTPMRALFAWQLVGDVIKLAGWLLAYMMLAKAMTKLFILTELVFSGLFILLTFLFVNEFGLVGVTYAFALNYSLYLLVMIWCMRYRFFCYFSDPG